MLNLIPKNQILSKTSPKPTLREREKFLLQKIRSGDKAAFMELVSPFQERLFRKAKSMVGDDDDAEDIVQDALISGYKSIAKFRADSGVYTWLYRIVVNKSKDLILKKKKSNEKPLNDNDQTFFDERLSYEKKLELSDESAYLIKKINMLEPMYRQVIDLRYYEELSYSEIADLLKCNVGTVKSRIFKAKELLKHLILNDEKEK